MAPVGSLITDRLPLVLRVRKHPDLGDRRQAWRERDALWACPRRTW